MTHWNFFSERISNNLSVSAGSVLLHCGRHSLELKATLVDESTVTDNGDGIFPFFFLVFHFSLTGTIETSEWQLTRVSTSFKERDETVVYVHSLLAQIGSSSSSASVANVEFTVKKLAEEMTDLDGLCQLIVRVK